MAGRRPRATESITEVVPLLDPAQVPAVDAAIAAHAGQPGALLPILHAIQHALGWIPAGAVAPIARALRITRADVHGVISFYPDFRSQPPPARLVRLCMAEACQSRGAAMLEPQLQALCEAHGDAACEPVYCLGNCALGPSALIDGQLHGRLDAAAVQRLLDAGAQA